MDPDLRNSSLGSTIVKGLLTAGLHILRRPDHLSVLALLSIGCSFPAILLPWCLLGLRPGIATMTAIFYSTSRDFDFRTMGEHWNLSLATLLLLLGLWGVHHYLLVRKIVQQRILLTHLQQVEQHVLSLVWPMASIPEAVACSSEPPMLDPDSELETSPNNIAVLYHPSFDEELMVDKCCCGRCRRPSPDITDPTTQTVTSAVFGVFQGLAVAGCALPPALLSDCSQVVAFLVSFCATSILVVGIMAAAFGGATARLSRVSDCALYRLGLCSSCACIGPGSRS